MPAPLSETQVHGLYTLNVPSLDTLPVPRPQTLRLQHGRPECLGLPNSISPAGPQGSWHFQRHQGPPSPDAWCEGREHANLHQNSQTPLLETTAFSWSPWFCRPRWHPPPRLAQGGRTWKQLPRLPLASARPCGLCCLLAVRCWDPGPAPRTSQYIRLPLLASNLMLLPTPFPGCLQKEPHKRHL